MVRRMKCLVLSCACVVLCGFAIGCVSQKTIDDYGARLKVLEGKGVPDSLLSTIRVYLSQAIDGKKSGNGIIVNASVDSLKSLVAAAEKWSDQVVSTAKPYVDDIQKSATLKKSGLTGMQLKEADSLLALISSLTAKNWYLQARAVAAHLDSVMPLLQKDEEAAQKVAAGLIGTWTKTKRVTENGANALEKGVVTFNKDGTFSMNDQMKGLTSPARKEDWQFLSEGAYSIKGDTLLLNIQKEKCVRESYENLTNGKWVKFEKKPYDTTITDGKKDQFFTFEYLKDNYKK